MVDCPFEARANGPQCTLRRRLVTQIEDADRRHRLLADPHGESQQFIGAALGVVPAFQGRRRAAEQDRHILEPGPHHRDVAGMVARRRFLFERRFVFFVDHN